MSVHVVGVSKAFPTAFGYTAWIGSRGAPPRRTVLTGITFSVGRGELFGLLGANGAGKSTLLRMLAGLVAPDRGRIAIDGLDQAVHPLRFRTRLGLCSGDERSFYYRLSARANLAYFGALAGIRRRDLRRRIDEVARGVDLYDDLDRRFDQFSAGMRQRLSFARALLADPDVLLLDEPTRAVDPLHTHELRRFVRDELVTRRGKTVILATNLLEEAWELCDRIAVLSGGGIATIATPAELLRRHGAVRRYAIGLDHLDEGLLQRMHAVPGLLNISTAALADGIRLSVDLDDDRRTLTALLHAVSSNGVAITHVQPETARPVDVFTRLTREESDVR